MGAAIPFPATRADTANQSGSSLSLSSEGATSSFKMYSRNLLFLLELIWTWNLLPTHSHHALFIGGPYLPFKAIFPNFPTNLTFIPYKNTQLSSYTDPRETEVKWHPPGGESYSSGSTPLFVQVHLCASIHINASDQGKENLKPHEEPRTSYRGTQKPR